MKHIRIALALVLCSASALADIVIYPATYTTNKCTGGSGCPGNYCSVATYSKKPSQGWGYAVDTNALSWTATDTNQPGTKVQVVGQSGDVNCNTTSTSPLNSPPASGKYRFAVYFPPGTSNTLGTNYPLVLHGFLP